MILELHRDISKGCVPTTQRQKHAVVVRGLAGLPGSRQEGLQVLHTTSELSQTDLQIDQDAAQLGTL
jgi:hypothetical protein